MNQIFKIILCTVVLISVCYATPPSCLELHQSQLTTLNERMNQMLSALYSSPILSKLQSETKTQPNPSNTTPAAETPEPVYDTSLYYPPEPVYDTSLYYSPNANPTPQVIYVPKNYPTPPQPSIDPSAPSVPISGSTRAPRSYYSYSDAAPLEYNYLMSPWSQYYDPYRSTISPNYPATFLQQSLTPVHSYDPYREPEHLPSIPYPPYTPPPTYHTPPPTYHTPPPIYQTPPPAYPTPPPAYHTPAPTYRTSSPTYHTPPPTYQTPPPNYHTPSPNYHTPPPIYSPSMPSIPYSPVPYSPVHYSRVAEYSPFYV